MLYDMCFAFLLTEIQEAQVHHVLCVQFNGGCINRGLRREYPHMGQVSS